MLVAKHVSLSPWDRTLGLHLYTCYNNSATFVSHFPLEPATVDVNNPSIHLALWTLEPSANTQRTHDKIYSVFCILHQVSPSLVWDPACHHSRPVWVLLLARRGWLQLWTPRRVQACLVWKIKAQAARLGAVQSETLTWSPLVDQESTLRIILQVLRVVAVCYHTALQQVFYRPSPISPKSSNES